MPTKTNPVLAMLKDDHKKVKNSALPGGAF